MPKTQFQNVVFTAIMAFVMVYGMIVYNISLNTGGVSTMCFLAAFHEVPIMVPIAFVLELFMVGRIAHILAFQVMCILSIGNPQNCHQNSLFLEREFLVFVRTRFLHSEVLSGASMHAASDNFSRRT